MEENNEQNNQQGQSNPLALSGFIVALCSLLINFGGIVGLVATVLSAIGLSKVKSTGKGKGFAIAGLVIGILSIVYGIWSIYSAANMLSNLSNLYY